MGPDATNWIAGTLPISSLYWVLFTGYAVGGRTLLSAAAADRATGKANTDTLATATG